MRDKYIEKYIAQGISVFACLETKAPATKNGFYDATTDLETEGKR